MHYTILYRGPLSSCNFGCTYCPFAKRTETADELRQDELALKRFLAWAQAQRTDGIELSVFFTPWGEALVRRWYQDAMISLSNSPHVRKVAVQTNLSCNLDWVRECDAAKAAFWCSYHPNEIRREKFLRQCARLDEIGVRYSVGVVGTHEHAQEALVMRKTLPPSVYLWINAIKRVDRYYSAAQEDVFKAIDPLFPINNQHHASLGRECRTGQDVFSVDGDGTMQRCHFVKQTIGNLYNHDWRDVLKPSTCTNTSCGCHIGYVHMPALGLAETFAEGILERVPTKPFWSIPDDAIGATSPKTARSIVRMSLRQVSARGA